MIKTLKTIAFLLEKIVSFLCVVIIGAMTVTVLLGVLFRYVFLNPLGWSEELARYLMIWGASLAISLGVKNNEHVGLTILSDSIKSKFLILLMDLIVTILVFAFLMLMIIYGLPMAMDARYQISLSLPISMAIPTLAVPVSMAVALVQLILKFLIDMNEKKIDLSEEKVVDI